MFYYITVSSSPRKIPEKPQHDFSDADQPFLDGLLYNAQNHYRTSLTNEYLQAGFSSSTMLGSNANVAVV
jgi:hypothetical protein